ncbi:di-heme oxidoredictase family protein [Chromatocurvus halotolerans]|uniref:di-heme oxidoredictase family protein n=1 Tax=Chromatocurvus halotolerans TaxID=1132028 RepID=UPI0013C2F341|nr:di-heme oxidoredictase family protein [Chromatocurvus halotolerans]
MNLLRGFLKGFAGILLALQIAGCDGGGHVSPFAAGGTALTVDIPPGVEPATLLHAPLDQDASSREGQALFQRDWGRDFPGRRDTAAVPAVTDCADCHVEAVGAGAEARQASTGRQAPPVFGWGLLAAVPAETLQRMADPGDADGDGISGQLSTVPVLADGTRAIGRFGWKSAQPDLYQQIATALIDDLNVSTHLYPNADASLSAPRLSAAQLAGLERYVVGLAVPARRQRSDPEVIRGERLFAQTGCATCHVPVMVTGEGGDAALSNQVIWPYSDLLLHDMGVALAESEDSELRREWRTPPLWGIGLMRDRYPRRGLLHDGRAPDLHSAILWHGGEARVSRDAFRALPATERDALLSFLRSL